jgi:hypothetical protein
MLWDLTWAMSIKYGLIIINIGTQVYVIKSIRIVLDGIKLQPYSPTFVDAKCSVPTRWGR